MKYIVGIIVLILIIWGITALMEDKAPVDTAPSESGTEMVEDDTSMTSDDHMSEEATHTLDTTASTIGWTGSKVLPGGDHSGTFGVSEGSFTLEEGNLIVGKVTIDMTSLVGDGSGVADHLRGADFFEIDTYPTSTFVVTGYEDEVLSGDLTIKGVTMPVSFPVTLGGDGDVLNITAAFEIDRTEWGLTYGSGSFFDDLGDKAIEDMVQITFDIVAHIN